MRSAPYTSQMWYYDNQRKVGCKMYSYKVVQCGSVIQIINRITDTCT